MERNQPDPFVPSEAGTETGKGDRAWVNDRVGALLAALEQSDQARARAESDAAHAAAVMEGISNALDGDALSDFLLSFPVVRACADLRNQRDDAILLRDQAESQRAALQAERDEAVRTVTSIATMLGWMNVPPRDILESDLRAQRARFVNLQADLSTLHAAHARMREVLVNVRAMVIGEHGASAWENINGEMADAALASPSQPGGSTGPETTCITCLDGTFREGRCKGGAGDCAYPDGAASAIRAAFYAGRNSVETPDPRDDDDEAYSAFVAQQGQASAALPIHAWDCGSHFGRDCNCAQGDIAAPVSPESTPPHPHLSDEIVAAMNREDWREATMLLIQKVDGLYRAQPPRAIDD